MKSWAKKDVSATPTMANAASTSGHTGKEGKPMMSGMEAEKKLHTWNHMDTVSGFSFLQEKMVIAELPVCKL